MTRSNRMITPHIALSASLYFRKLLERIRDDDRSIRVVVVQIGDLEARVACHNARLALAALPKISLYDRDPVTGKLTPITENQKLPSCDAFRAWLDTHITDAGWSRCLTNSRRQYLKDRHEAAWREVLSGSPISPGEPSQMTIAGAGYKEQVA
jgi:hypothetical protein